MNHPNRPLLLLLVHQNADNNHKQLKLLMPIKCIFHNSTSSTACNPGLHASIGAPEPTAANILCPPPLYLPDASQLTVGRMPGKDRLEGGLPIDITATYHAGHRFEHFTKF